MVIAELVEQMTGYSSCELLKFARGYFMEYAEFERTAFDITSYQIIHIMMHKNVVNRETIPSLLSPSPSTRKMSAAVNM
jgi:hypothetical protein